MNAHCKAKPYIHPDTRILDDQGRDWTWAFVVHCEPEWAPRYIFGSDGGIWSRKKIGGEWSKKPAVIHPMKIHESINKNYLTVTLRIRGDSRRFDVHTLILKTFLGPRPHGKESRHLDGNSYHNDIRNLIWGTRKDNAGDRVRHGTACRGEKHGAAVLTEAQVHEMKRLKAEDPSITYRELGKRYGVVESIPRRIIVGERWKHIGNGPDST